MEQTKPYLANFERFQKETAATTRPFVKAMREAAIARFAELGFPTAHDEEWRFTPLAALLRRPFEASPSSDSVQKKAHPGGVIVCGLTEALERFPSLVEPHLGRYADAKGHAFVALNTAFLRDGIFIYIPPGANVEEPIYLQIRAAKCSRDHFYGSHRRVLVVCGDNSRATVVESYHDGVAQVPYFNNSVTEAVLGHNANLDHYKVLNEGGDAFHFHSLAVQQERGSTFSSCSITAAAKWVRNEVRVALAAEGCECTLNGLYLANGEQFVDNHTRIDHARPHCTSHEFYKGILDGKARGVFNGKIFVHPDAQKTDARQTNKTLLLSDDAMIDAKPQLEIYADDVKCTHGATIGQLDDEAIFYLRSRGLGRAAARQMLTYAFANDVIGRVRIESLRASLEAMLFTVVGGAAG